MRDKFRILLFVLTVLLVVTAITINKSVNESDILVMDAEKITHNIHDKEEIIDEIFGDSLLLKTFANSERYPLQVREISKKYASDLVFLYVYKNSVPIFWPTNVYVPLTERGLHDGPNFLVTDNRFLIVKPKKISSDITLLAIIPVKRSFNVSNEYFRNRFAKGILDTDNLDIASLSDTGNIRNIYAKDGTYLFSVKIKSGKLNNWYLQAQLLCWILAIICFVALMHNYCLRLAKSGKPWLSLFMLILTLVAVRILDLEKNWLVEDSSFLLFDPQKYAFNYFYPNLWSFLINSISIFWVVVYFRSIQQYIKISINNSIGRYVVYYILLCTIYAAYHIVFNQIVTIVTNSSFSSKEVLQLFNFDGLILVFLTIYCLSIFSLILFTDGILSIAKEICPDTMPTVNLQLAVLVQFLIITAFFAENPLVNVLIFGLMLTRSLDISLLKENKLSIYVLTLLCLAVITSVKYSEAYKLMQQEQMKMLLTTLESEDDIEAVSLFSDFEYAIQTDKQLLHLFNISLPNTDTDIVRRYLIKKYLTGYLSNYELKDYYYYNDMPLSDYGSNKIEEYREKVINESSKVVGTDHFYKSQTAFGAQEYFALFTLYTNTNEKVSFILNFSNTPNSKLPFLTTSHNNRFQAWSTVGNAELSYALYKHHNLVTQQGDFTYSNNDKAFEIQPNEFVYKDDKQTGYFHVLYKPDATTTLIASRAYQSYWQFIGVASLSFILMYVFTTLTNLLLLIFPRYLIREFNLEKLKFHFRMLFTNIRYSTRIQSLVISSVIVAIVITGIISYISISYQREQDILSSRIRYLADMVTNIENNLAKGASRLNISMIREAIDNMTAVSSGDYNLYNQSGKLVYTTQSKIYDQKLISEFINPDAFLDLNVLKKTETIGQEFISDFAYDVTYAPIRNSDFQTVAYLSIPYYNSKEEAYSSENVLLNTILNIYTIIVIVFAFLSVFISNKITMPLQVISKKLAQTNLSGKPNEPLYWEKNDEIGVLVKEYNYMLVKLEENARQLRNAERETAWREMAQQVAHEIKNPLTPMKLGIQQLSRSFYENDPRLEERFAKVSNSFIEQIDALAHIASEFSAFAKLPDTKFVPINIVEKITKSMDVYNNSHNTLITLDNNLGQDKVMVLGDRAQLLRTFNNLIKNAIEAGTNRRKHRIVIAVKFGETGFVRIEIKDNGYGISEEILPNIFRPNFTTKSSGTGLGLAFVKQTIEGMGGTITFETKLNIGTIFFIDIPLLNDSIS